MLKRLENMCLMLINILISIILVRMVLFRYILIWVRSFVLMGSFMLIRINMDYIDSSGMSKIHRKIRIRRLWHLGLWGRGSLMLARKWISRIRRKIGGQRRRNLLGFRPEERFLLTKNRQKWLLNKRRKKKTEKTENSKL